MSKIINFENTLRDRMFKNEVVPFIYGINPAFQHHREENKALFYFNFKMNVFIFMKYIYNGEKTIYPTLEDSMKNVHTKPRISNGEWVVEKIHELNSSEARLFLQFIYKRKNDKEFIDLLKEEIYKSKYLR